MGGKGGVWEVRVVWVCEGGVKCEGGVWEVRVVWVCEGGVWEVRVVCGR